MLKRARALGAARWVRLAAAVVMLAAVLWSASGAVAAQQPPPKVPEGFVPVDQLPEQEHLPAAPLLMTAYALAWLVIIGYVWSLWSRLGRVERELGEVARRVDPGGRR